MITGEQIKTARELLAICVVREGAARSPCPDQQRTVARSSPAAKKDPSAEPTVATRVVRPGEPGNFDATF
ncbi:MAG: hypothetical protein K0R61_4516 [Microvirga sp.]|nr:hypothetical protein [Microvirga sp.]